MQHDLQLEGLVWCVCYLRPLLVRGDYYSDWGSEMSKETGGQAFPRQQWEYDGQNNVLQYQEEGMTLRDYFAAKVMVGIQSNPELISWPSGKYAEYAYEVADAMLKARG